MTRKVPSRQLEKSGTKAEKRRRGRSMRLNRKLPNWPLLGLSLTGMALAGYLSLTAWLGSRPAYCAEGSSCDLVQTSHWSTLLGLPIAFWGFLTYASLAYIAYRVKRTEAHWSFAWIVSLLGLGISLYLTAISLLAIGATCLYCMASLALMAAIFGVVLAQKPPELPEFRWPSWLAQTGAVAGVALVVLHLHFLGVFHPAASPEDPNLKALAIHLTRVEAKFYGAYWCDHCQKQKAMFGPAAGRLPYVECSPEGPSGPPARGCVRAGVRGYPTWVIGDEHYTRAILPRTLARYSGFEWNEPEP